MTTQFIVTGRVIEVSVNGFRVDGPGVLVQIFAPKAIPFQEMSPLLGKQVTLRVYLEENFSL